MTDEQLRQLAALAEAATPARWIAEQGMGVRLADYTPICMSWNETCEPVNVEANMAFIAAARQAVPELLAEVSGLRRQLAEERMRANAAEFAVAQLRAEAADLRRQLERAGYEYREVQRALVEVGEATGADDPTSPESILDALADLRRQVEHANRWRDNEILAANEARAEAADLRRQLDDVPMDEIDDLYVAYAYAVSGWPEGKAQEFPRVGRWLGILPAAVTPHRAGKGDE